MAELFAPVVSGEAEEAAIATGAEAAAQRERLGFDGADIRKGQHRIPPQAANEDAVLRDDVTANDEWQCTEWHEKHRGDGERTRRKLRQTDEPRLRMTKGKTDGDGEHQKRREERDEHQGAAPGGL